MKTRRRIFKLVSSFILVVVLVGCGVPTPPRNGEVVDVSPFLYQVIDDKGQYVYLLGTCHPGRPEIKELDKVTEKALSDSDNIYLEVTMDTKEYEKYTPYLLENSIHELGYDDDLDQIIDEYPSLQELVGLFNLNAMALSSYVTADIMNDIDGSANNAIDEYIFDYASKKNNFKEVEGLETQFKLFSDISKTSTKVLLDSMKNRKEYVKASKAILDAYYDGDVEFFEKDGELINSETSEEMKTYQKQMIDDRNVNMANTVINCINNQDQDFIGVGCRHLYGETGIIKYLEKQGYQVKSLNKV